MTTKKIALVTGTSSGIGLSAAIALAKADYHVIATMRNIAKSDTLKHFAEQEQVHVDIQSLDVQDDESVAEAVRSIIANHGHIDLLVNNAGAGYVGTTEQTPIADLQHVMDVNLYGVWRLTQAILPHMRKAKAGRILTVSSIGGIIGQPFNDAYCAAKFAIEGMMESLAPVVAGMGIHVSVIEPGPVSTQFVDNAAGMTRASSEALQADPYAAPMNAYLQSVGGRYASIAQTGDDIAAIIAEVAQAEKPHFRYQTSDFVRNRAEVKFVDASGDKGMSDTKKMLWSTM